MRKIFAETMTKGKYLTICGYKSVRKIQHPVEQWSKNVSREFTAE